MAGNNGQDPLAYGDYHPHIQQGGQDQDEEGGERGFIGDTFRRLRGRPQYQQQDPNQPQGYSQSNPPPPGASTGGQQSFALLGNSLFNKLHGAVHDIGSEVNQRLSGRYRPTSTDGQPPGFQGSTQHRYGSFATERTGNDVKWYVDGCGYMWAVSRAFEEARESIWILDCKKT